MSAFPFWQAEAGLACEESELWRLGKPPATDRLSNGVWLERVALHLQRGRHTRAPFMSSDQFWSIFAMPIGLFLCFTPILIVWVRAERKDEAAAKKRGRR